jgi:hypothetical protein
MRRRAETEVLALPQIYKEEVGRLCGRPMIAAQMPTFMHLQAGLSKHRHKQFPPLPHNRNEIVLPLNLSNTLNGQNFLLHAALGNEILIFATAGK